MNTIYNELKKFTLEENIKVNEPLQNYTYTRTGGRTDFLISPNSYEEIKHILEYSKENHVPFTILGNGSNLIIKDGGIRGIVLLLNNLSTISHIDNRIVAQSGATIIDTSNYALTNHLSGLEFSCGIPGSVGGAVFMNAGAYGGEISETLESILVLTKEGEFKTLRSSELDLSYRHSNINKNQHLVLEATFLLTHREHSTIKRKMDELTFLRNSKQPLEYPSCGSVFKRPPGHFAGKLIEACGLSGFQIGGVQVSTKHAGFMVNVGDGTATNYIELIEHVQNEVWVNFNVVLEPEVKVIGED